jgi:lipopolysaccharide transport system permease protein
VPDIAQIVNIALLLFMFISPIGFTVDSVPVRVRALVYLNPLTYLIEAFRFALIGVRVSPMWSDALFLVAALGFALAAATFFRRMSPIFSDYE